MSDRKRDLSFGRYLMSERLNKGISLKDVSRATRIGSETLLAIENEDHDALPAEVFVKGFLRSYARVVGADAQKAVSLYLAQQELVHSTREAESDLIKANAGFWRRFFLSVAVLLGLIVAALYADRLLRPQPQVSPETASQAQIVPPTEPPQGRQQPEGTGTAATAPVPAAADVGEESEPTDFRPQPFPAAAGGSAAQVDDPTRLEASDDPEAAPTTPDSPPEDAASESVPPDASIRTAPLVLQIEAVEETWVKVIIDIDEPSEYSLHPGDRLMLEGSKGFNILVGNATGVRLTLNEKPVPVPGKKGQVVNLQLP